MPPVVCLSPTSHGSKGSRISVLALRAPQSASVALLGTVRGVVGSRVVELAIERRAADLQPARDFGHLPAIMRDREADDLIFHFLERPDLTGCSEHREAAGIAHRHDRY